MKAKINVIQQRDALLTSCLEMAQIGIWGRSSPILKRAWKAIATVKGEPPQNPFPSVLQSAEDQRRTERAQSATLSPTARYVIADTQRERNIIVAEIVTERDQYKAHAQRLADVLKKVLGSMVRYEWHADPEIKVIREPLAQWEGSAK